MNCDVHSSIPRVTHKRASFATLAFGWLAARFRDVTVAADVLHDIQWAAPWDDGQSPPCQRDQSEPAGCR
jgi:hypothetical protein